MNQPEILIRSMRNGKFYPVNIEDGEIELHKGEYIMKATLEYQYELIESNDNFCIYKRKVKRTFLEKTF